MTGKRAGRVVATLMGVAAMTAGCTKTQLQGDSSSYLIVQSMQGASVQTSGSSSPAFSGVLESDVCVHPTPGALPCTIFEDLGEATFTLALKNPGSSDSPTLPTSNNFVTLNRYHVDFVRADGHNTQGVDVPYSFDGAVTATVSTAQANVVISLVRVQAKLEAPLAGLVNSTTTASISTIAKITFYGTDQAGRDVSVVAQIGVNFADWADPKTGSGN